MSTKLLSRTWPCALLLLLGCPEEQTAAPEPSTTTAASAAPEPAPPASTPAAAASAPAHDCPEGSSGEGSFKKPCAAKGAARMMEVTWTGKMTDTGPSFRVTNVSDEVILYGKLAAYFYDKAGKQLEVKGSGSEKSRPYQPCFGNIFAGVMKPKEKAVLTFSCVKKEHVPEGTAFVEGEMQMVGFADESGQKAEYYWKNEELAPDERPKGGVKAP